MGKQRIDRPVCRIDIEAELLLDSSPRHGTPPLAEKEHTGYSSPTGRLCLNI
jgi:hypothetical protein